MRSSPLTEATGSLQSAERRSERIQRRPVIRSSAETLPWNEQELAERAAVFAARCPCRWWCGCRGSWRERPRCAHRMWPCACPEGSLTPCRSLSLSVFAMISKAARSAVHLRHLLRAIAFEFVRTNWPWIYRNGWSTSDASSGVVWCSKVSRKIVAETSGMES
jgi:hypothetical protein